MSQIISVSHDFTHTSEAMHDLVLADKTSPQFLNQGPPALPPKEVTMATARSIAHGQRQAKSSEWRNSLIVVDDETGTVVGVVAAGVVLSPANDDDDDQKEEGEAKSSSSEDESEEAITPTVNLDYMAAHVYNDPDVRPPSRAASILREDTFAPPPIPMKPNHLQTKDRETNLLTVITHPQKEEAEEEKEEDEDDDDDNIEDGKVKVNASHAEAHRPDLLRERSGEVNEEYDSDASGSTVGGPAVQLWRKARGGKKAEAKRKAKREAKKKAINLDLPANQEVQEGKEDFSPKHPDSMPQLETSSKFTASRLTVSDAGDEEGAIKLNTRADAGYWLNATKKSVMSRHLPGNSVLIEFLAGSRIGASVIKSASSSIPQERAKASLRGPDVFTPTSIASIPQTGVMSYIPVLPSHLLWFFGLSRSEEASAEQQALEDESPIAGMGEDLLILVRSMTPSGLIQVATQSANAVWANLSDWSTSATSWLGSGLSFYSLAGLAEVNLNQVEAGEDDAEVWKWTVPEYDPKSLENTPRPVYRRKKLLPSMDGHFTSNQQGSKRYSIVHVDHLGIPRRAVTRLQQELTT